MKRKHITTHYIDDLFPKDIAILVAEYEYRIFGVSRDVMNHGIKKQENYIDRKYIAMCRDGRIVSVADNKTFCVYDPVTDSDCMIGTDTYDAIRCIDVLPDGRIVTGSTDHNLKIWTLTDREQSSQSIKCDIVLRGHHGLIHCIAVFSNAPMDPWYYVVSGSGDQVLKLWKIPSLQNHAQIQECEYTFVGHDYDVISVIALSDNFMQPLWDMKRTT